MAFTGVRDFSEEKDAVLEILFFSLDGFNANVGAASGVQDDGLVAPWCFVCWEKCAECGEEKWVKCAVHVKENF
jgi:hypothetical protein